MKKRIVKKVAVLGSGAMGAQIACQFANIGLKVLLLDIVPEEPTGEEKEMGLSLEDAQVRNRIVNENLKKTVDMDPAPLYRQSYQALIETGNFEDDLEKIADVDWVLEAVLEKLEIKRSLLQRVDKHRRPGTLISTNTSGIPIHQLIEDRSEDFRKHFCGTHFFNPPRYLALLEIIPSEATDEAVIGFLDHYGDLYLGKTTVICKDTPAFIGNRIGLYAIMLTIGLMQELDLTISEVDALTGKAVGRPKTATFRTADLVGIDIMADVAQGIYERCRDDQEREVFKLPQFVRQMIDDGRLGAKTGEGFYKKIKENGRSVILALDPQTRSYRKESKPKFPIIEEVKQQDTTADQLQAFETGDLDSIGFFKKLYLQLFGSSDEKAVQFFRRFYYRLFAYCSHRIPEIAEDFYQIDRTLRAGFNWKLGPFEIWDVLGVAETVGHMEKAGHPPAQWVYDMLEAGVETFYKRETGVRYYYDRREKVQDYAIVSESKALIRLDNLREENTVWRNAGCNIVHVGDGVLNVEFVSKRNTINLEVIEGLNHAVDIAEDEQNDYRAIVIGNEGDNFSFGADLAMIGINAYKGNLDTVKDAVGRFQQTVNRLRHCAVPVVAAAAGRTLGGGVELCMYCDAVQAAAETYMGLVEFGVGLIPAGGGTSEFVRRAALEYVDSDPKTPHLQHRLMTIAQAKVATSAIEAFDLGYLREGIDRITMNKRRLLTDAKHRALDLARAGYTPPARKDVTVLGQNALSFFYTGINNQYRADYISAYDAEIARQLALVMCGGELSAENKVPRHYLFDLEREAFMELVRNKKTLKRIEHMLKEGKPLRN
jgi:3-hydroxyacyl-CoA dehydrogenase